jgi:outer membrane protein, heavy metal efflux system
MASRKSALVRNATMSAAALAVGCTSLSAPGVTPIPVTAPSSNSTLRKDDRPSSAPPSEIARPAKQAPAPLPPLPSMSELSADSLVEQVLARNPTFAQMVAAWKAANARYPQVTSLEDPMFGALIGPASLASRDVEFAYRLEASQRLPYPGKLDLRGRNALAEADAAGHDVDDVRLQLIESAQTAFYEYYLVHRAIAINEESLQLLLDFRELAEDRFETGQAPQQDILQADVQIGRQRERGLTLKRMRNVAVARINTLMHLPPNASLPLPPNDLKLAAALPPVDELLFQARAQRPT